MGEAICLIIDVGATASARYADGPSFLDAALECASLFVERKLFAETKDEIGIVLFGTEETRNGLDYEHVTVLERGLARPDWDTVAYLR
jgi:ATP-dependent DNA helicase 2 subunit 2